MKHCEFSFSKRNRRRYHDLIKLESFFSIEILSSKVSAPKVKLVLIYQIPMVLYWLQYIKNQWVYIGYNISETNGCILVTIYQKPMVLYLLQYIRNQRVYIGYNISETNGCILVTIYQKPTGVYWLQSIYKFGLSVCLFVSNKRQNG